MSRDQADFTTLLHLCNGGDADAAERLLEIAYPELRRIAGALMRGEKPGSTLQPTALAHEAYMSLFVGGFDEYESRTHFFAVAATNMRRLLINRAKRKLFERH